MMDGSFVPGDAADALFVNGQAVALDPGRPARRLLDILRDDLGLTGAKPGCRIGRCGACTVLLDGTPVPSCLVLAGKLPGRTVWTIEATSGGAVRQAMAAEGGFQCGYCTAGLVVSLEYWFARVPRPARDEVEAMVAGHLCRCTGYAGIRRAIATLFEPGTARGRRVT